MNWFGGSIPEAITAAKTGKAVFVVYVRDSSEASKITDETLSHQDIAEVLSGGSFVSIQLENGTEDAKQFSQIYPLVLVPSLFFISGETGVPLEVLGGPLTPEHLKEKINKLIAKADPVASTSSSLHSSVESNTPEGGGGNKCDQEDPLETSAELHQEPVAKETKLDSEDIETVLQPAQLQDQECTQITAEASAHNSEMAASTECSLEDKVERAKALLAEKQSITARAKAEEERQKEINRRRMGQEMAKKKLLQEEEELKAAVRERRRDKEEDRLARERVKAQIAADRAEKEARAALMRVDAAPVSPAVPSAAGADADPHQHASNSNMSRLKFRLPDGSSSISQFQAETTLGEVKQYIEKNVPLPFSTFTLASTVQHRPFTAEDYSISLRDLGLVPSAILVILPSAPSGPGRLVSVGGNVWDILWLLLSPITFLFGLVKQLLSRRGDQSEATGEPQAKRSREDPLPNSQQRPPMAYGNRGEARLRQQGNIHRLQNDGDDDDENNTWNGNSTQQM